MIFLTVGTQLPFDRLTRALDDWAGMHPDHEIIAQTGAGQYQPQHFETTRDIAPAHFADLVRTTDVIVCHAGMGTIIAALEIGKPCIIMPRRADLGEHRNDHQSATARRFCHFASLSIVEDSAGLARALDQVLANGTRAAPVISNAAGGPLISAIREFLAQ